MYQQSLNVHTSLLAMHRATQALLACAYQSKTQRALMTLLATHKMVVLVNMRHCE